jgi:hypothetical protein
MSRVMAKGPKKQTWMSRAEVTRKVQAVCVSAFYEDQGEALTSTIFGFVMAVLDVQVPQTKSDDEAVKHAVDFLTRWSAQNAHQMQDFAIDYAVHGDRTEVNKRQVMTTDDGVEKERTLMSADRFRPTPADVTRGFEMALTQLGKRMDGGAEGAANLRRHIERLGKAVH